MVAKSKPNELTLTRTYQSPLKLVWDAWTDPRQVEKWWGPRGFTLTTHRHDLRTGGIWDYTMHGPDGVDYANKTKYLEVEKYSRLVYDHGGNDERPPLFRVTVIFTETADGTKMEMTMACPTPDAAAETKKFIKKAGGDATWDRLAEFLAQRSTGKEEFVTTRTFDAPVHVLFELWTDPKHLANWMGPAGSTTSYLNADVRPGGHCFYKMTAQGGTEMYGRCQYLEVSSPHRLVYTQQFCDAEGKVARHPFAPTWPETMLTTVTFVAEGPDKTRVRVAWEATGTVSAEELATFVKSRAGMTHGWAGSFDRLEEYVDKTRGEN